jgi:hypothetical protein
MFGRKGMDEIEGWFGGKGNGGDPWGRNPLTILHFPLHQTSPED